MSGPFKVGDVVVCWREPEGIGHFCWNPRVGGIYTVSEVCGWFGESGGINLAEDQDYDPEWSLEAAAFKRLPKADEQFIADMRACKPIRRSVDA